MSWLAGPGLSAPAAQHFFDFSQFSAEFSDVSSGFDGVNLRPNDFHDLVCQGSHFLQVVFLTGCQYDLGLSRKPRDKELFEESIADDCRVGTDQLSHPAK